MKFMLIIMNLGQGSNGLIDQIPNRPRFFTTVPSGVYLPPSKDLPIAAKARNPRTYTYFSIPKIFAQNIDKGHKESPLTEIHAIKAMTTFGKSTKLRYVFHASHTKHKLIFIIPYICDVFLSFIFLIHND